ncbi:hypothetical protein Pelo_828 [Pelomyxa schiedti]|nr:hypothetical protein Pelo_828 [Pelomyxa schiedti]
MVKASHGFVSNSSSSSYVGMVPRDYARTVTLDEIRKALRKGGDEYYDEKDRCKAVRYELKSVVEGGGKFHSDEDDCDASLIYHYLIPEEYKLAQWDSGPDGYSDTVYFLSHDKMLTLLETPAFKNASICDKKPHSEDSEDSESSPDSESEDEESPAKKKPGDPGPGITNTGKEESPKQKSSQKAHHSHDSTTPTTKHKAGPQPSSSSTSTASSSSSTTVPSKPNTVPTKHKKKKRVYFKTDTASNKHPPAPDDDYPNETAVSLPSKRPRNKDAGADTASPTTERPSPPSSKRSRCSKKH